MKYSPLISVIVPIYNIENYLSDCINSVLSQTFTDFELLLIDDGSKDKSGEICDEYAKKDNRIRVFHKNNGGVSSARNYGIQKSYGVWITFVDSDDWLDSKSLENYVCQTLQKDTLYIQQAQTVKLGQYNYWPAKYVQQQIHLNRINDYKILNSILVYGTPWGKLYHAETIKNNHLLFDERLSLHEDHCFYFNYIKLVRNIYVIENIGYYYRIEKKRISLSSRGNMPSYNKLLLACEALSNDILELSSINQWKKENLNQIYSLIFAIKIRAVRSAFYNRENKMICCTLLNSIKRNDILSWYHPNSLSGKFLKRIFLNKSVAVKYYTLKLLRKKLNK